MFATLLTLPTLVTHVIAPVTVTLLLVEHQRWLTLQPEGDSWQENIFFFLFPSLSFLLTFITLTEVVAALPHSDQTILVLRTGDATADHTDGVGGVCGWSGYCRVVQDLTMAA